MRATALLLLLLAPATALGDRQVRIQFDAANPWDQPVVEASGFGGRPRMLLDTGMGLHAVAARLAPGARAAAVIGSDVLGRPIRGAPVDGGALAIPGWGPVGGPIVATAFIDELQTANRPRAGQPFLDGALTPQLLAGDGRAVLLDFQRGVLADASWEDARARLRDAGVPLGEGEIRAVGPDHKFVVEARACGAPVKLVIDTGAQRTSLYRPRDVELPDGFSRAGQRRTRLRVGEVEADVDAALLEPAGPPIWDGLLGMDVLRRCVLALDGERLLAACAGAPAEDHERALVMPHRAACVATPGRAVVVQAARGGPSLRQHADGSYTWAGDFVAGRIRRDGTVEVRNLPMRSDAPIPLRADDRDERRWFLDETLALRVELWQEDARRLADQSIDGLPSLLDELWTAREPAPARRAALFALWDDAVEPDDPTLGVASARARRAIDRFIRRALPAGTADGFTAPELQAMNARRPPGTPRFDPYTPPPRPPARDRGADGD